MSGPAVVRSILVADSSVTALVPASRIIADEVAPQGTTLPFILIKHISGTDRQPLKRGGTVFSRKRVQVEMHCASATQRMAVKTAIRAAGLSNQLADVAGYQDVTLHTEGEGPDFYVESTNVRIGEQDFLVTYSETI